MTTPAQTDPASQSCIRGGITYLSPGESHFIQRLVQALTKHITESAFVRLVGETEKPRINSVVFRRANINTMKNVREEETNDKSL